VLPGMDHHIGPVHVELKLHIALVDQLASGDSQFNKKSSPRARATLADK